MAGGGQPWNIVTSGGRSATGGSDWTLWRVVIEIAESPWLWLCLDANDCEITWNPNPQLHYWESEASGEMLLYYCTLIPLFMSQFNALKYYLSSCFWSHEWVQVILHNPHWRSYYWVRDVMSCNCIWIFLYLHSNYLLAWDLASYVVG